MKYKTTKVNNKELARAKQGVFAEIIRCGCRVTGNCDCVFWKAIQLSKHEVGKVVSPKEKKGGLVIDNGVVEREKEAGRWWGSGTHLRAK